MSISAPTRERKCPERHSTITEAIRCAEKNLGVIRGQKLRPYWGTTRYNSSLIVGWQIDSRRRWRLDFEPGQGKKGMHINEENFELPQSRQKVWHQIDGTGNVDEYKILIQYRKWTSAGPIEK